LRWFWWRINAYSELAGMIISFAVALYFEFAHTQLGFAPMADHQKLLTGVGVTTVGWLMVTFLTRPTAHEKLVELYKMVKPASTGWQPVLNRAKSEGEIQDSDIKTGKLPLEIACMLIGCVAVYAALFGTGFWIYGNVAAAGIATVVTIGGIWFLFAVWKKLRE